MAYLLPYPLCILSWNVIFAILKIKNAQFLCERKKCYFPPIPGHLGIVQFLSSWFSFKYSLNIGIFFSQFGTHQMETEMYVYYSFQDLDATTAGDCEVPGDLQPAGQARHRFQQEVHPVTRQDEVGSGLNGTIRGKRHITSHLTLCTERDGKISCCKRHSRNKPRNWGVFQLYQIITMRK